MNKADYENPTNQTIYITLTSGRRVPIPPHGRISIDTSQIVKDTQFSTLLSSGSLRAVSIRN